MKTSVIEVDGMLSVLSVDEVEKRIGEVPGVESITVNYAAGSATVRYDETRLEVADIKSEVRQRAYESDAPAVPKPAPGAAAAPASAVEAAPQAAPVPKVAPVAPHVAAVPPAAAAASATSPAATKKPGTEAMPAGMKMPDKAAAAPQTDAAPTPAGSPAPLAAPEVPSLLQRLRLWLKPADTPVEQKPAAAGSAPAGRQGNKGDVFK